MARTRTLKCKELQADGNWWEDLLVNRCTFPIGPINTFSNLAYVLAGLITWLYFQTPASAVFGFTMLLLGLASGYYHGFKNKLGGKLDDNGMYAVFTALLVYTLNPHAPGTWLFMLAVTGLVVWQVGFGPNEAPLLHTYVGIFTAILVLKLVMTGAALYGLTSLGVFGLAYFVWWQDQNRTFFWPRGGHGVWHLLTALALTLLFWGTK